MSKSHAKRQAFLEALALMAKEGKAVVKAQVCRRACVTPPFVGKHPDLQQALENAQKRYLASRDVADAASSADRGKDRTISMLLGKLAANSPLSDTDLHKHLVAQTQRAERAEVRVNDLETRLFAKRVVRVRDKARSLDKKGTRLPGSR